MKQSVLVTSKGTGTWGAEYEVELSTVTRTWTDISGENPISQTQSQLNFRTPGEARWDHRRFDSDQEREAFLKESFSVLELRGIPATEEVESPYGLEEVVGEPLEAVTFVANYVQLQFHGQRLNAYVYPLVVEGGRAVSESDDSYRSLLCSLIGSTVVLAEESTDLGVVLKLDNGAMLAVSPSNDESAPFEIAEYTAMDGTPYIWTQDDLPWASKTER